MENVLFKEKGSFIIKVVDFGIAGVCKAQKQDKTDAGTLHYMSPEVLSRSNVNAGPAIDVWALGIMLYVMIMGELPFNGDSEDEIVEQILKKKLKFQASTPVSSELKDLLNKMLAKDPEKRISMFDIQNSQWMEMMDDELEVAIENAKTEEEEKKQTEDELEDVEYLSKLKLEEKLKSDILSPKDSGSSSQKHKKGASPRGASPRAHEKKSTFNGSIKKGKGKVVKKKKAKPSNK